MEVPERLALIGGSILLSSLLIFGLKDQMSRLMPNTLHSVSAIYDNNSELDTSADVQAPIPFDQIQTGSQSATTNEAVQKLYQSAQKIAPQYGVLPSVVLADAGAENPSGPGNNFWGIGYNDETTANNQGYLTVDDGIKAFLNTAIDTTQGQVQSTDAQQAMQAMANADGRHSPLKMYHSDPSSNYWNKIASQYKTYDLGKYDQNINLNLNNHNNNQ